MAAPKLPQQVIQMLVSPEMREHHATWHLVRDRWHAMSRAEQQPFIDRHWAPPRLNPRRWFANEPPAPPRDRGSGLDFLFMHRRMIEHVNALLVEINEPNYPRVTGWNPIPWDHDDPDWPMPPNYPDGSPLAKDPAVTARWKDEVAQKYENDAWLRTVNLDDLGAEIENGVHNWMHMHWASDPWFKELPGQDEDDPRNDYLGSTYSSHVNEAFWKLHGWIDDRIGQWERVTGDSADFSTSWEGPSHHDHIAASLRLERVRPLLSATQRAQARRFFLKRLEGTKADGLLA